jgi:predicted glycoside hydrolase/deacetylase ChbG (UPF0249 family)
MRSRIANLNIGKGHLLSVNADDWGRSQDETDAAAACYSVGRITSVSAMVFMEDSERAANLARKNDLSVGLHLNLNESFSGNGVPEEISREHAKVARFLNGNKYSVVFYNPFLRKQFSRDFQVQLQEFLRLYGKAPSHFDGHMHHHLCSNMLVDRVIPAGQKVRLGFSFSRGERTFLNVIYRNLVNDWIKRQYVSADYFFSLHSCLQNNGLAHVAKLARAAKVELMVHPKNTWEYDFLMGDSFDAVFNGVEKGSFSQP